MEKIFALLKSKLFINVVCLCVALSFAVTTVFCWFNNIKDVESTEVSLRMVSFNCSASYTLYGGGINDELVQLDETSLSQPLSVYTLEVLVGDVSEGQNLTITVTFADGSPVAYGSQYYDLRNIFTITTLDGDGNCLGDQLILPSAYSSAASLEGEPSTAKALLDGYNLPSVVEGSPYIQRVQGENGGYYRFLFELKFIESVEIIAPGLDLINFMGADHTLNIAKIHLIAG